MARPPRPKGHEIHRRRRSVRGRRSAFLLSIDSPVAARRPAICGGREPLVTSSALPVQSCGGQTDPETPSRTLPTNNRDRTNSDTTGHSHNTGLRAPSLYSQERNPNDEECRPSRTHCSLAEHPAGPGRALSGSSSLVAVHTIPRRDHPARAAPLGRSTSPVLTRQSRRDDGGLCVMRPHRRHHWHLLPGPFPLPTEPPTCMWGPVGVALGS